MRRGAEELKARLSNGAFKHGAPSRLCLDVADAISQSMGGTSGALLELAFRSCGNVLSQRQEGGNKATTEADWRVGFEAGVKAIQYYGGATVGYRTMVDALEPARIACASGETAANIVAAAKAGAEATKGMAALAGRSNYVPRELLVGVPDPGAVAVVVALEKLLAGFGVVGGAV